LVTETSGVVVFIVDEQHADEFSLADLNFGRIVFFCFFFFVFSPGQTTTKFLIGRTGLE